MAETWEIILWVIVAAAVVILIVVAIAITVACRRRNRRKKNVKHKRFEWGKSDETDFGKRKVYYDASSGQAKILDQTDSGAGKSSQRSKVEYNARTEEARILGVGGNERGFGDAKTIESDAKDSSDESQRIAKFNDYLNSSYVSKESRSVSEKASETKKTEVENVYFDERKGDYVTLQSAPVQRERLQPMEMVPREPVMTSQSGVSSYTNLGYSQSGQHRDVSSGVQFQQSRPVVKAGQNGNVRSNVQFQQSRDVVRASQNGDLTSNVQFQQPVAVVKAFVNPGQNTSWGQTRSLPRNYSKLNYKKSFTTSTTPRRKPLPYTWSINRDYSETQQPWLNLPITYKVTHPHAGHRRTTKHRGSTRSRSFTKRSLRKQRDKKISSLNGVYITNSRPRRSYQQNAKSSSYYQQSTRPYNNDFAHEIDTSKENHKFSKSDRRSHGGYYEEEYKMVKKSEFPAFNSSSSRYESRKSREPEISSIVSGSEFSDFLPVPPRPSDSQSDGSAEGYSRGSYKEYKNRLAKSSEGRREMISESTSRDRAKHTKSFQETLESLRNGDIKDRYGMQHEVTETSESASPWVNNDSSFRKQHGVPITGVPVLPPEPVFIHMEDSGESDYESRKQDETD